MSHRCRLAYLLSVSALLALTSTGGVLSLQFGYRQYLEALAECYLSNLVIASISKRAVVLPQLLIADVCITWIPAGWREYVSPDASGDARSADGPGALMDHGAVIWKGRMILHGGRTRCGLSTKLVAKTIND